MDASEQARWEPSGPDSDSPPWAKDEAEDEQADTDERGREDEPTEEGRDGPPEESPSSEDPHPDAAPPGAQGQAAGGPGSELEARRGMPRPQPPPRRTGVFVDPADLREHVGDLLRVMLGGYQVDAFGNFMFVHDGARIYVTVGGSPIGPQVGVFSVTNVDVDLGPKLATFMATTNHTLGFGALSYDADNRAVWLRHTLLGTTLDGPELQTAVAAVASTAARIDDHIAEHFGGRTFDDAPEEVQNQTRPPETPQTSYTHGDAENVTGYL